MKLVIMMSMFLMISVSAADFGGSKIERQLKNGKLQKFDGNKYMIVRKGSKRKVKTFTRYVVRKIKRNHFSLLAGRGPLGNLKISDLRVKTEQGAVLGLQYMRFGRSGGKSFSIQALTNKTLMLGVGVGF